MLIDLTEELRISSEEMKEKEGDFLFHISINYFYDGECIDLGARLAVCDSDEENFRFEYHSFTLGESKNKIQVLEYVKAEGEEREYARLQILANDLREELLKCAWIDSRTEVEIDEYD